MSDNPFAPRSYVENVANHLAWRRSTHLTNVAEGVFLIVAPLVAALVLRHPAATTAAAILGLVGLMVLGIDRWDVGRLARRPVTREYAPVTPRGIASDALAWRALAFVAVLLVG